MVVTSKQLDERVRQKVSNKAETLERKIDEMLEKEIMARGSINSSILISANFAGVTPYTVQFIIEKYKASGWEVKYHSDQRDGDSYEFKVRDDLSHGGHMINKSNYKEHTDKYFLRSKEILEKEEINPLVRYQVFARKDIPSLKGIDEAVAFIRSIAGDKVKIYSLRNGDSYSSGEPIMKLEGRVQDLIDTETGYLGIMSGALTGPIDLGEVRKAARGIREAAGNKKVLYMGARHFSPSLDEKISRICQEEGFDGASTDIGARAWGKEGMGTEPHALIMAYTAYILEKGIKGNPTVEATKGFDKHMDKKVPRIALVDTFNQEVDDTMSVADAVSSLKGARVDTCGENYSQLASPYGDIGIPIDEDLLKIKYKLGKYLSGQGVKIWGVWVLRRELDKWNLGNLEITVSSGFNEEKTKAFMEADALYQEKYGKPLFDSIGTGSIANPVMTTSDIVAYYSKKQGKWVQLSKKGRDEKPSQRLREVN